MKKTLAPCKQPGDVLLRDGVKTAYYARCGSFIPLANPRVLNASFPDSQGTLFLPTTDIATHAALDTHSHTHAVSALFILSEVSKTSAYAVRLRDRRALPDRNAKGALCVQNRCTAIVFHFYTGSSRPMPYAMMLVTASRRHTYYEYCAFVIRENAIYTSKLNSFKPQQENILSARMMIRMRY